MSGEDGLAPAFQEGLGRRGKEAWLMPGLYIDLPGVWPLHCHIGWHLSEGKLAAMVYLPGKVKRLDKPSDWTNVSRIPHRGASGAELTAAVRVLGQR